MTPPLEAVRAMVDAWNRNDFEAWLDGFDPECEVQFRPQVPEPGPFHGREELRGWAEGFRGAMGSGRVEITEVLAESADRAVVVFDFRTTGAGSGVPIGLHWANVFEFRNGRIVRWHDYDDPDQAVEAAGLSA